MLSVTQRAERCIRERDLMHAGDRVAVAVSGGADSVGLLRILLQLREELGIVLSVAHFHHGIRGTDADADEKFVAELASAHGLEFLGQRGNARAYADQKKLSLEAAARQLRHGFFESLLRETVNRIATAHTLDDQAETVLMKVVRGAGTRGMAGIFPEQRVGGGASIVRPLLGIGREEVRAYLRDLQQPWREDVTNGDLTLTRNRVRARVIPVLREQLNPAVDISLAHLAEISLAEEQYWTEHVKRMLPLVCKPGEPARGGGRRQTSVNAIAIDIQALQQQQLAVQRRLLRAAAEQVGCSLDFEHLQAILDLLRRQMRGAQNKKVEIADGWSARLLFRELRLERSTSEAAANDYEYCLSVPGESRIPELGATIRARISEDNDAVTFAAYNRAHAFELPQGSALRVRNWRAGDHFRPARHTSEKRVKQLLYPLHLSAEQKRVWPVIIAGERIVWVRGIEAPALFASNGQQIVIEESTD